MKIDITWKKIERYIYLAGIVVGALLWWRDEAKDDAFKEVQLEEMKADITEIKTYMERNEGYWKNQNTINGGIAVFMGLDIGIDEP